MVTRFTAVKQSSVFFGTEGKASGWDSLLKDTDLLFEKSNSGSVKGQKISGDKEVEQDEKAVGERCIHFLFP